MGRKTRHLFLSTFGQGRLVCLISFSSSLVWFVEMRSGEKTNPSRIKPPACNPCLYFSNLREKEKTVYGMRNN